MVPSRRERETKRRPIFMHEVSGQKHPNHSLFWHHVTTTLGILTLCAHTHTHTVRGIWFLMNGRESSPLEPIIFPLQISNSVCTTTCNSGTRGPSVCSFFKVHLYPDLSLPLQTPPAASTPHILITLDDELEPPQHIWAHCSTQTRASL